MRANNRSTIAIRSCASSIEKIGQYVYFVPRDRPRTEDRYIVMRLLPRPKREPRYIIRSEAEPEREYTVEAGELRRVQGGR